MVYAIVACVPFSYALQSIDPALESKVNGWIQKSGGLRFVENKGQLADLQNKTVDDLLFKTGTPGLDMYITTFGLSYVFTHTEKNKIPDLNNSVKLSGSNNHTNESVTVHYCRADMELLGAEIRKENILKENESEDHIDYYHPQCPDGAINVHSYEKITVKEIYSGIDWVVYSRNGRVEYDFIVHPGADPSQIRLHYKWADKPILQKDGSVKISTPMGDIIEGMPLSYGRDKKERIITHYDIRDNEVVFIPDEYNKNDTLVIDPTVIWATYYGGGGTEEVNSINTDGVNVWVTGDVNSAGFPTLNPNSGAYFQQSFNGKLDLIILQFSTCGKLIWSTYYGGTNQEEGKSISSDGKSVWVTGNTNSSDFPLLALSGAYNQSSQSSAFILQFNCANEKLIWATYFGGSGGDQGSSIHSDGKNLWVTGYTQSTDFPVQFLAGAYNQNLIAGFQNAFISQFSCSNSAMIWASYYGGSGFDGGGSVSSDGTSVWLTGFTQSTDFPVNFLAGAYNQPALGGLGGNSFISQFSCSKSNLVWASYYGGSGGDQGNSISSDGKSVWVTGQTHSTDFPLQSLTGAYNQAPVSGGEDGFVLQFNCATGARIWATCYGGSKNDFGNSISSDGKNTWVCGATSSTDFPTMKPDCGFFQDTLGSGGTDVFVLQFNSSGVRKWATYYGEDNEDDGSFISSDGTGVFVSGDASSGSTYPIDSLAGAYFDPTFGGLENVFIAKFSNSCSDMLTLNQDTTICPGSSVILSAVGGSSYSWAPAAGLNTVTGSSVMANPTSTTSYTVSSISGSTCSSISASVRVTVSQNNCDSSKIFVPNVFSPNGDGKNDQFYFTTKGITDLSYQIYNRWGGIIYKAVSIDAKWDGKNESGATVPDGVYYYTYSAQSQAGKTYKGSGFIQLLGAQ